MEEGAAETEKDCQHKKVPDLEQVQPDQHCNTKYCQHPSAICTEQDQPAREPISGFKDEPP